MSDDNKIRIQPREITEELRESYLDYAMSVIVARALPDVRDGLKPVHRRVLWAMWDAGLTHLAKFRKSANVVGETMAKYHPHGDMAIYDTLVRMAQDFSLRYPLINGQGNWGSIDGDNAAAMRYTEAKLSKIAEEMLVDIEKDTVDWRPNYDGTRDEPTVLPSKLPNLLLNGTLGIAVGMATSIPPHNLNEVADAALYLADNSDATSEDLMQFIKGPDFPTGGIIFDARAIKAAYVSGRGGITARAKAEITEGPVKLRRVESRDRDHAVLRDGSNETGKAKNFNIVITEIPYQVNKSELVKRIAELVQEKKIEGIRDLRDESDREGLRIVVELKNDVPPQKVLNQLYQHTDLQKDFHLNTIALMGGIQPQLLSIKDMLAAYLEHRRIVVRRRTQFELKRAEERAHILQGLHKALGVIDRVIATIKGSSDKEEAHKNLIKNFKLTDVQATAILEMRLQTLAALERKKIEDELKEKKALIEELGLILKSQAKILKVIKDEIKEIKEKYGDERRTRVVPTPIKAFKEEDLVPNEDAIVTFSAGGYIKRLPPGTFRSQKRGGKGLIGSEVAEDDFLAHFFSAKTHDNVLFFTDHGRVLQTKVYEIPQGSRTAKGRAIHNFLELPTEENVTAIVNYSEKDAKTKDAKNFLAMVTKRGLIKKTALEDFENIRRTGIIAISLRKGDLLQWVKLSSGKDEAIVTTRLGQSIRFKEAQARPMGRSAAGVRAIRLKKNDEVAGFDMIKTSELQIANSKSFNDKRLAISDMRLLVVMENGFGKQTPLKEYKVQNRGGSGIRTAKITAKTGSLVSAHVVGAEGELFALSAKGQIIRTRLESIRQTGRSAQGVRIMNVKPGDKVAGTVVI